MTKHIYSLLIILILGTAPILHAGEVDVVGVEINELGDNRFRIDVTLKHEDTGWDHFANKWDVLDTDGNIIGTRVLAHPHVNEQPFTRSLTLTIPSALKVIVLRGTDSVHEEGGATLTVDVPGRS